MHENPRAETHALCLNDEVWKRVSDLFSIYQVDLRYSKGKLAGFWMLYLDLVEIMLGLIRAEREGDWNLHLACIRKMIPWCFTADKTNYARYLPAHVLQMASLKDKSPEVHSHFLKGGFTGQLGDSNPFLII